jgi:tetratricopeptide (TPR) repeat protein
MKSEDLAYLLACWVRNPGRSRFLFTSRPPFELPDRAHRRLEALHLGPLSFAETRKLLWRLPGLDALSREEQLRAYTDVGGHPRTLEYLDALLRGGESRFPDIAERMESVLERKGVRHPEAWLRRAKGDLDQALAEAVTLAVDDVLLDRLLEKLEGVPLAKELLLGASVYRIPVDAVGLAWQVGEEIEIPGDRERGERIDELGHELGRVRGRGEEPSPELLARIRAELPEWRRPPLVVPEGFVGALEVLGDLGLLAPIQWSDTPEGASFVMHRWTASAVLRLSLEGVRQAQQLAARYWHWRADRSHQSRQADIAQLLEARHHYHMAGDVDQAVKMTEWICSQLDTWGAYRREEQLCREALIWLPERSAQAAVFLHQLGILAYRRSNYDQAQDWYKRSLQIEEELGNRENMARAYHQLGVVAQQRGAYDEALDWSKRSLPIFEELGNRPGMANSYHQLGVVAQQRGAYVEALDWYKRSLQINEELGNSETMASSYQQLGRIAQERDAYDEALDWYKKSLQINEKLGNRVGMAISYHWLGSVAHRRSAHDHALQWYKKSLQIFEELGNQAGIANSYHQLGLVAEELGAYAEALDRYTRTLQIFEELGDRAGMAISHSQLGVLATKQGYPEKGLLLNLRGLVTRLEIRVPGARNNFYWLRRQLDLLGEKRFGELLREYSGDKWAEVILGLMAQAGADSSESTSESPSS